MNKCSKAAIFLGLNFLSYKLFFWSFFKVATSHTIYVCLLRWRTNKQTKKKNTEKSSWSDNWLRAKTTANDQNIFQASSWQGLVQRSRANQWLVYFLKLWLRLKILSSVLDWCLQTTNETTDLKSPSRAPALRPDSCGIHHPCHKHIVKHFHMPVNYPKMTCRWFLF